MTATTESAPPPIAAQAEAQAPQAASLQPHARHPFLQRRLLLPLLAVLLLVHLPFLHHFLRGQPEVTQAVPFSDSFDRPSLGSDWYSNGGLWRLHDGQLYTAGSGNNPLWLKARLPADVRVSFDVRSEAATGDIKWELFGDGRTHSTGYVFIFGGWDNGARSAGAGFNRIARLDEHGFTAEEIKSQLVQLARPYPSRASGLEAVVDAVRQPLVAWSARRDLDALAEGRYFKSNTPFIVKRSEPKVVKGQRYHMVVTRRGRSLRWEADGALLLEMDDPAPLAGPGHDRFGFSSWANETWFDNLKIEAL
jgi:hypothetical protein